MGTNWTCFKHAHNWKNYYAKFIRTFLNNDVLEVGAGIGETTRHLCDGTQKSWLCVEPDPQLVKELVIKQETGYLPPVVKIITGTIDDLDTSLKFDAIIYIDVIEHIENDNEEMKKASSFLKPGGKLIVLVPAHNYLLWASSMDKALRY